MTKAPAPAAPRRRRRWLRRLIVWPIAFLLLLRVAIWIALPIAVESVFASAGFASRWERLDLSLLAGTVELSRLELSSKPVTGSPPPPADARLDWLSVDLDVLALFRGTVRVRRVDVDGVAITLRRGDDGHVRLCGLDLTGDGTAVPPPPPPPTDGPAPWDFTLPVQVMALRLQNTTLALRDDGAPQEGCQWQLALSATDIGVPERDAMLDLDVHAPGILDALRFEARGRALGPNVGLDLTVMARGLHPHRLASWLAPLGLRPAADQVDLDLQAHANAAPTDASNRVLSAQVLVTGLSVRADGSETAAIDRAQLQVRKIQVPETTDPIAIDVEVAGVRAVAEHLADGSLRALGFDFLPGTGAETPPKPAASPSSALPPALTANIRDVNVTLRRQDLGPDAAPLELKLAELSVLPVQPGQPQPFVVRLHAPGVVEQLSVEGSLQPNGDQRSASFRLDAQDITMARLQPLLRQAGLEAEIERASLRCRGSLEANSTPGSGTVLHATLADLVLRDRDDLLNWPGVEIEATAGRPGAVDLDIARIAIRGPELRARIDREGALHFLGLRTVAAAAPAETAITPPPQPDPAPPPLFRLGRFDWTGLVLRLSDERHEPTAVLALTPVTLTVTDVSNAPGATAGRFELRVAPEGVAQQVRVAGALAPEDTATSHNLRVQVGIEGATLVALRPWLEQAGIRSELRDGRFAFELSAARERNGGALRLALENLDLRDGEQRLFSLAAVTADGVSFQGGVRIASLAIRDPHLGIEQLEDGTLRALGLAILPRPAAPELPSHLIEAPAPRAASPFAIDHLELSGLTADWQKAADGEPVRARVTVAATVDQLRIGDAEPATFRLEVKSPGKVEQLEVTGNLRVGNDVEARGRLQVAGIQPAGLRPFLPPGMEPITARADLACAFHAAFGGAPDGGLRAEAGLSDLTLTGDEGAPLFAAATARVRIDRFDPDHGVLHVGEVKVLGTKIDIARDAAAVQLLGMRLLADRQPERAPAAVAVEATARPERPAGGAATAMQDMRIDDLEVELAELRLRDLAPGAAEPVRLQLRLRGIEPLIVLGPEIDTLPPLHLLVEGALEPLATKLRLDLQALPFAPVPEVRADFETSGLQVAAFERLLPELAGRVRDDGVSGGSLTGKLLVQAQARNAVSGPFDWSRDFRIEAELTDLYLRGAGQDRILAGIDAIRVDARRISPATGDVDVRTIEVLTPRLHARQTQEGLHVFGLLLLPATNAPPEPQPVPQPPRPEPAPGPRLSHPSTVSVASILFQGIDVVWRDETTTPPFELPFDNLDFEITGCSTRALEHPEAIRFRGSLETGVVELLQHQRGSLLGGILGAATGVVGGGHDAPATERRALLEEIALSGQLALMPSFHLDAKLNIEQFELTGLRGLAGSGGIEITDGTFSAGIQASFDQAAGFSTDSRLVLRNLAMKEPNGGPISTYLRLPMGLDAVLFALRDENGEQQIPLQFRVGRQGISTDRVVGMAVQTLSELLTKAVARSPFRLLKGSLSTVGIGGGASSAGAERAMTFAPGSVALAPGGAMELEALAGEVLADERIVLVLAHELGTADMTIATQLANPPSAEVLSMVHGLRQRRDQLLVRRAAEQQAVRVQAGVEGFDHPRLRDGLRAIDTELGTIERALDRGLQLLQPSAERRVDARTRRAALTVANQRLETVRNALVERGVPADRIEVRRPQVATGTGDGSVQITPRIRSVQ